MPKTVLRHPDQPGAPYVYDSPDGVIPVEMKQAGWQIDTNTTPEEAEAEAARAAYALAEQSLNSEPAQVTPRFADEVLAEEQVDAYETSTVKDLQAQIDARNEGRPEGAEIVPASTKKADLIAALIADDEAAADASDTSGQAGAEPNTSKE